MKLKMLAAAIAFAGIATPAFAQFWIVRDGSIGRCVVVDKEPTVGTIVIAILRNAGRSRNRCPEHVQAAQSLRAGRLEPAAAQ